MRALTPARVGRPREDVAQRPRALVSPPIDRARLLPSHPGSATRAVNSRGGRGVFRDCGMGVRSCPGRRRDLDLGDCGLLAGLPDIGEGHRWRTQIPRGVLRGRSLRGGRARCGDRWPLECRTRPGNRTLFADDGTRLGACEVEAALRQGGRRVRGGRLRCRGFLHRALLHWRRGRAKNHHPRGHHERRQQKHAGAHTELGPDVAAPSLAPGRAFANHCEPTILDRRGASRRESIPPIHGYIASM
jgi:hypothetical protein